MAAGGRRQADDGGAAIIADMDRTPANGGPKRGDSARRLLTMFTAPGKTFAGLAETPALASALAALALAGGLEATALSRATDLDRLAAHTVERQLEDAPSFLRNQSRAERERTEEAARQALGVARAFAPILGALGAVINPLAAAAVFLLAFGLLGVKGSFRHIYSTVLHAAWPAAAARAALTAAVARFSYPLPPERAEEPLRSSLAAAAPDLGAVARAVAGRIELFLLWELALTGIGFAIVLGVSRRRSFGVVVALWALVTAFFGGMELLREALGFRAASGG